MSLGSHHGPTSPRAAGRGDKGRTFGDERPRSKRVQGHHSDTHAWRGGDAPLRRKFRGAGSESKGPREEPAAPKKAGLVADRKGRRVLVERFGEKPPERADARPRSDKRARHDRPSADRPPRDRQPRDQKPRDKKPRDKRPHSRDRAFGPRPSRPRGPRER